MSVNDQSEISKMKEEISSLRSEVNLLKNKTHGCCYCEKKGRQKFIKGRRSILAEKGIQLVHHMSITNIEF